MSGFNKLGLLVTRYAQVQDGLVSLPVIPAPRLNIGMVEAHGLAPILNELRQDGQLQLPAKTKKELLALQVRHARAGTVLFREFQEIVNVFSGNNIDVVGLKGIVLSRLVYRRPQLRPMRDLDILVKKADLPKAQQVIRRLGYHAPDLHLTDTMHDHHHLPPASKLVDGFDVSVEIHHNALASDTFRNLGYENRHESFQQIDVDGFCFQAFSHIDMLDHLCRHLFEPGKYCKLINALDIVLYVQRFSEEIDWQWLRIRRSDIFHSVQLVHMLVPLPRRLQALLATSDLPQLDRVGECILPLSVIRSAAGNWRSKGRDLLLPSEWWLYGYYGRNAGKSRWWLRFLVHPWRVFRWLFRRFRAVRKARRDRRY